MEILLKGEGIFVSTKICLQNDRKRITIFEEMKCGVLNSNPSGITDTENAEYSSFDLALQGFHVIGSTPAKIEFEKALKLDMFCAEAEMGLFKAGIFDTIATKGYDPEILLKRIQVLMKLDTAHAHAYVYMGDLYSYIHKPQKALAYYDTALQKDTTMASAFFGKALIYDQLGNKKEMAVAMYKKALDISPWNRYFIGNLAYQYYRNHDYKEAIRYCDSLEHLDPSYIVSYYTMASSYLCIGDLNACINCNANIMGNPSKHKLDSVFYGKTVVFTAHKSRGFRSSEIGS